MKSCRPLLIAGLLCAGLPLAAQQGGEEPPIDTIELKLGYGFGFPPGTAGTVEGPVLEDLIRRVLIDRAIHERLFLNIDYDSERTEGGPFLGGNTFSLSYQGEEDEFLRELSIGNKLLSIPGTRYAPIDEGNRDSVALRARTGSGRFGADALVRYGISLEGKKRFRGNRRLVETTALDVDYVKARFFLLPDNGIDEASLRVYRSTQGLADRTIDGKPFVLLSRQADYVFDNSSARISLLRSLGSEEELAVTYTKAGVEAGDVSLGILAIIKESDGTRADFNKAAFPDYFAADAGPPVLYLRKIGKNSYWEMRNAYFLEELPGGQAPADVSISLTMTKGGAANDNYGGLLDEFFIDPAFAILFFTFRDSVGLYPRPFPGAQPFAPPPPPYAPNDPGNPFSPANPIYGGIGYPTEKDSINTLAFRYTVSAESFFLEHDLIEGSVRVTVDGLLLSPSQYSMDYEAGVISFTPGVIGPSSEVEVSYRYAPAGGGQGELSAALGLSYEAGWLQVRNLAALTFPIQEPPAPQVGEERGARIADSADVSLSLGAPEGAEGYMALAKAGAALSLVRPNAKDAAIVADMEAGRRYAVSVVEDAWMLGSRSGLLPALSVPLNSRGELRYENLWEERLIGGDVLHGISWDNSANPQFSYGEKAGPYNSSDSTTGGESRSLVLDFAFPTAANEAYVCAATHLPAVNLKNYTTLNVFLRGAGISGDSVRLYAELLDEYPEDLNGNGILDGESTSAQAGFTVDPPDGPPTVIGTDRYGQADDKRDSEDLDGNGALDPGEKGAVLAPLVGPAYLVELPAGDREWKTLSLDLREAIAANPGAFQRAKAVRLTVKPASSLTPTAVSGKVLVNGIWFAEPGLESDNPDRLAVSEISSEFSLEYPEIYEELHGSASYREKEKLAEKALLCRFTPTLATGETANVIKRFGAPADLSQYKEFRMYLYLPAGQAFPAEARLTLEFRASSQERYGVAVAPEAFAAGWNEIRVGLEAPYLVEVRGVIVGELERIGMLEVWRTVKEIRFGLAAESGDLTAPFEFQLDEWHLRGSRWSLNTAFYAEGTVGHRGPLLSAGEFPLVADAFVNGGYERVERTLERYHAGAEAKFLRVLSAKAQWSGSDERPEQEGRNSWSYTHRLGLDAGIPYLPVLEHSYQRSSLTDDSVELTDVEYLLKRSESIGESLSLSLRYRFPQALLQSYAYSRSWRYERRSEAPSGSGTATVTGEDGTLAQRYEASAELGLKDGRLRADASREESLLSLFPSAPPDLIDSYVQKLATLFRPAAEALPGAQRSGLADRAQLTFSRTRTRYWGANLSLEASYNELNADPSAGVRDANVLGSWALSLPFSPNGEGTLLITPKASRTASGSFRDVQNSLGEEELLMVCFLPLIRPPLYFMNPSLDLGRRREHEAMDGLDLSPQVAGGCSGSLRSALSLEGSLKKAPWFIPSRTSVSAGSETSRDGQAHAQKRSARFGLGKDFPAKAGTGLLAVDAFWEEGWDYTNKVRSHTAEARTAVSLSRSLRGELSLDHTLSYTGERQRIGDEGLYLFPEDPSGELPVPVRPASDTVRSSVNVQCRWEQTVLPKARSLRLLAPTGKKTTQVVHTEKVKIENQLLFMDRSKTTLSSTVPVRLTLEHSSWLGASENAELGLNLKAVGGLEEKIEEGQSLFQPSLGIELYLGARLLF